MKSSMWLALAFVLSTGNLMASEGNVFLVKSGDSVSVRFLGEAAKDIKDAMTKAPSTKGGMGAHLKSTTLGKSLTCTTTVGINVITHCKFSINADGVMSPSLIKSESSASSGKVVVLKTKHGVTVRISGIAGAKILEAMKNVDGYGTMSTTKSSGDITCSKVNEFKNKEGSCSFSVDALGSANSLR